MIWSYAVTTVPERIEDPLPRTLCSLAMAGWDRPRLSVDGEGLRPDTRAHLPERPLSEIARQYEAAFPSLSITVRSPNARPFANWYLAALELYLRVPLADRYALFQDDIVVCRNTRAYLESIPYPEKGYCNLYTHTATNEPLIAGKVGWIEGGLTNPPPPLGTNANRWQAGRSATALVFNRAAMQALLTAYAMVDHATDSTKGWRKVDGAIVNAMNQAGFREYVHAPSLAQHTGERTSMRSLPQKYAASFPGEEVDALEFLTSRTGAGANA